jgi:hypothetical protein
LGLIAVALVAPIVAAERPRIGMGNATIAFVQSASATMTTVANSITVNINSTAGDALFVAVSSPTAGVASVTDSAGTRGYSIGCELFRLRAASGATSARPSSGKPNSGTEIVGVLMLVVYVVVS